MKRLYACLIALTLIFSPLIQDAEAVSGYKSLSAAGAKVRSYMKNRKTSFTITLKKKSLASTTKKGNNSGYAMVNTAYKHTGKAAEGDYIYGNVKQYRFTWQRKGSITKYQYTVSYRTSASQEAAVTNKVNSLIKSWHLSGKSDYTKAKTIYDYITSHVSYDYSYTYYDAYSALLRGKAVCHGYALLFYRMALAAKLKARLICGYGNGGSHSWNIVKIGSKYYNIDSTWDAGRASYSWFLKGKYNFANHSRESKYNTSSFNKSYPMANYSY